MDPKRFYGKKVCVREIPDGSDDSELSTDDEVEERELHESTPSSDSAPEDCTDDPMLQGTSAKEWSSRNVVRRTRADEEHITTSEPQFLGHTRKGEPPSPKLTIDYMRTFLTNRLMQDIVNESNLYRAQKILAIL